MKKFLFSSALLTFASLSAFATTPTAPTPLKPGQSLVAYECQDNTSDSIDALNADLRKGTVAVDSASIAPPYSVSAPSIMQLSGNCYGNCACAAVTLTKQ